jgi:hypothetical protein
MRAQTWLGLLLLVSCGGKQKVEDRPRGYAELMTDANQHERKAEHHEQVVSELPSPAQPENFACGDTVLNDQVTTGTERVTTWMPCWDPAEEAVESHRAAAARERKTARQERAQAVALARAELTSCRGIPARELTHTPLSHRKAIAEVIPHREGDEVRGVHIIFKRVPGLDARWMERAIGCHRARAAVLGRTGSPDPTMLPEAQVTVSEDGGRVNVFVRTPDNDSGQLALARAQALSAAQSATR